MKTITQTRKIAFYPVGDTAHEFYSWLRNETYLQNKAKQLSYNYLLKKGVIIDDLNTLTKGRDSELDDLNNQIFELQEKIKKSKSKDVLKKLETKQKARNKMLSNINKESHKTLVEAIGYDDNMSLMRHAYTVKDYDGIELVSKSNYITSFRLGIRHGEIDFKNDFSELMKNNIAPRVYKNTGVMDIGKAAFGDFYKEGGKYFTNITSKFPVKFNLGSKPSQAGQAVQTLNGIIDGSLKLCESKLQIKNNKLFMLLVVQQEVEQPVLDKEKVMGIDLGMDIPAYVAMEFKPEWGRAFGNKKELLSFKTKIKKMKDLEKQRGIYARGGHGRKRKLKNNHLEALRNRESNFAKTYNHTLSKQIVDYAIKNKVGTIRMEKLDGKSFKNQKMLGDWTYYMLQQMIQTKGEAKGINVEFVNPAYTSSVCSTCGHHKAEFKLGNRDGRDGRQFHCDSCGLKINSDHNAAINISKGGIRSDIIRKIQEAK